VLAAAETALDLAAGRPLVFGGDLNLRPRRTPEPFEELERRLGFRGPAQSNSIDHLLVHGLAVIEPSHALPDSAREVPGPAGRLLRLSDHPSVAASFSLP
jgi:hypothetical protein